jgi:predicted nucleotidyltransferase
MINLPITPHQELDSVLKNYASKIQKVLGDNFVGFYLQGSLAIGDFDHTSDIDFIVVVNKDLSKNEVANVQTIHLETYNQNNRWVKHLEYSFFPRKKLKELSSPFIHCGRKNNTDNGKLWYFDNGSKTIERSDHCNTLVTRWTLREKGIAVLGPDIKTLVGTIDPNDLRKEIKSTMMGRAKEIAAKPEYIKNRFYQSYLVLNYARMLQDLYEGKVTSKKEGMAWAKQKLNPKWINLIDFCWQERQDTSISINQPINPEIFKKSLEFVKYATNLANQFEIN